MMWLRDNQPRCWALWFLFSYQAACLNHHRAGAEPARSWGNNFYINYLAVGCRQGEVVQREGGAAENDSEKWRNSLLKEIRCSSERYDTAGRLKAVKGRQKGCTSAHLVPMYFFAFIFFVVFQASYKSFAKDSYFQSKPKSQGTVVVHLIYEYFFLFCFSEMSCWGNKSPCNFQQWEVNQFFCLKKKATSFSYFHI